MIKSFERHTNRLTDFERKEILPKVVTILSNRIGRDKALKNGTIVGMLDNATTPPRMRKIINYIRRSGLVKGLVANSTGYYVAESEQDLIEYEQSLKGRERAIREVRMSIRKQRKDMYGTKLLRGRYK